MCPPMRAHWRHLANTIELVLPSAHLSPKTKRQIDRFSHFCTGHSRVSLGMPGMSFPLIIAPSHGGSGFHLIHASLGPPESISQTASRTILLFLHSSRQSVVWHVGACPSPSKLPLPIGDLYPHLIRGFFGLPDSASQRASRSAQPFLHSSRQKVPILYHGRIFSQKLYSPMMDLDPV